MSKVRFIATAVMLFGLLSGCAKTQYVMETSNGLEKEGIIVDKVNWKFTDKPVEVYDNHTGETVLVKGYRPLYTNDKKHFYVYGIIESDSDTETYMYMRFDARMYSWEYI